MSKELFSCQICYGDGHLDAEQLKGFKDDCKSDSDKITAMKTLLEEALNYVDVDYERDSLIEEKRKNEWQTKTRAIIYNI